MTNIIVPVNNEEMLSFCDKIVKRKNLHIIIGVTESLKDKIKTKAKNVSVNVFSDKIVKEEMINDLKKYLDTGKVVIVRKNIDDDELDKFINSESEITMCKINRNKFQTFWFNLWQKIMKMLFGFKYFEGDISIISFSENLFNVINNIDSLSSVSRVNKWRGVSISYIDSKTPPVKKEYNKVKANLMLFGWIAFSLAIIASTVVFFLFVKATIIYAMLFTAAIFISVIGVFIASAIYGMNIKIGQKNFEEKKEIKK